MPEKQTLNMSVRIAIEQALVQLMRDAPIEKISVSAVIRRAGVARTSFYRNYQTKEDVLVSYTDRLYSDYFAGEGLGRSLRRQRVTRALLVGRYRLIREHADLFVPLVRDGLLYKICGRLSGGNLRAIFGVDLNSDKYLKAQTVARSAALIEEWIRGGFAESEAWMAAYTLRSMQIEKKIMQGVV